MLIHDGARPLVDNAIIQNVVVALEKHSAVACAIKVKDTIKKANIKEEKELLLKYNKLINLDLINALCKRVTKSPVLAYG